MAIGRDGNALHIVEELRDDANEKTRRLRNINEDAIERLGHERKIEQHHLIAARLAKLDWTAMLRDGALDIRDYVDNGGGPGLPRSVVEALDRIKELNRRIEHAFTAQVMWNLIRKDMEPTKPQLPVLRMALDIASDFYGELELDRAEDQA